MSEPKVRNTKQRSAVLRALAGIDDFRSAQDLHDVLRHEGDGVGLTTVYRTLQSLAAAGDVDVLVGDDGETLYRRCSAGHHHHLVCRNCGRTIEVAGPAVEKWANKVAAENGYTDVRHVLEIVGLCPTCAAANP